jgi:hypothetical protein
MAIGDLVQDVEPDESLAIIQASASAKLGGISAAGLFTGNRFEVAGEKSFSGIASLLEHFHTCFTYGTDFGVESVAIPFSHVCVLCSNSPVKSERLEIELARKIEGRWKAAIDPATSARIAFLNSPEIERDNLKVCFGAGIFVPERDEQPVGSVEIEPLGDGPVQMPMFGDTSRPAGFYRAQGGLVFGSALGLAPASVDLGPSSPFLFFLGQGASALPPHRPLQAFSLQEDGSHPGYKIRRNEPRQEPDGDDIRDEFVVSFNDNDEFLMRYRADFRASRLRRRARSGRLAITGVIEPRTGRWPLSNHWWLDLDSEGLMTGSSLTPKARTIAVQYGAVHCYDWRMFAGDRKEARAYTVERATVRERPNLNILRRQDSEPFGFLQRPPEPRPVAFDAVREATDRYSLDWIDLAAGAEIAFRRQGLGSLLGNRTDITLAQAGADWAVRAPGGILYRDSAGGEFSLYENIPWQQGGQIALGPIILTMLENDGQK